MSYILVDGKRGYKNDRTGEVSIDNVSQEEAERRARQNQSFSVIQSRKSQGNLHYSPPNHNQTAQHAVSSVKQPISWRMAGVVLVLIAVIGAFIYNHTHISLAEQSIIEYMEKHGVTESTHLNSSIPYMETLDVSE